MATGKRSRPPTPSGGPHSIMPLTRTSFLGVKMGNTALLTERCGIQHMIPEITCIREAGHGGFCRSRSYRGTGGTVTFTEWESREGKFHSHVGYQTIHPPNAARR